MNKIKIILIFCFIAAIFSYAVLRIKGVTIGSLQTSMTTPDIFQSKMGEKEADKPIRLTEEDLNSLLKTYARSGDNLKTDIQAENIKVTGKINSPIKSNISVTMKISVKDEAIKGDISEMTMGGIKAPGFIKNALEKGINEALDSKINNKIKVLKIEQNEGYIDVYPNTLNDWKHT